jgi:hypothetical protein
MSGVVFTLSGTFLVTTGVFGLFANLVRQFQLSSVNKDSD